ncbi:hypothetical protein SRRS_06860 [Sporomusa rhizae]
MITAKVQQGNFVITARFHNAIYQIQGSQSHVNQELSDRVIPRIKKAAQ